MAPVNKQLFPQAGTGGAAGSVWYHGAGVPAPLTGVNGDFYLNTTNGDVYAKVGAVWSVIENLTGPIGLTGATGGIGPTGLQGAVWYTGAGAPAGGTGVNGDFYLNSANGDVYTKVAGAWGSPIENIIGPAGSSAAAYPNPTMGRFNYLVPQGSVSQSNYTGIGDVSTAFGTAGGSGTPVITIGITMALNTASGFSGALMHSFNNSPFFDLLFLQNTVTNTRLWHGLADQTGATMLAGTNPAGNYVGFMFDSASNANWRCVTKDNTTQSNQDSGVQVISGTVYRLAFVCDKTANTVKFYINGVLVATNTNTHLPTAATSMRFVTGSIQTSGTGNQPVFGRLYIIDNDA